MVRKAVLVLVLVSSVAAPAAAADGPMFAMQGGPGVVTRDGSVRYVTIGAYASSVLEAVRTSDGMPMNWRQVRGGWGIPQIGQVGDGLSRDGRTLVLAEPGPRSQTTFLLLDPKTMRIRDRLRLHGTFSFDAFSPDARRLYLVEYRGGTIDHYVVRAYDLAAGRLLPGRIADRTQRGWVMQGMPVTRTTSSDGRWVYTLYSNPGGYAFVHALDTVRGVAHCVGVPLEFQNTIYNLRLGLDSGLLRLDWKGTRPFVQIDTTTWRLSYPHPAEGRGWTWPAVAGAALLAAALALGAWRLRPRRAPLPASV